MIQFVTNRSSSGMLDNRSIHSAFDNRSTHSSSKSLVNRNNDSSQTEGTTGQGGFSGYIRDSIALCRLDSGLRSVGAGFRKRSQSSPAMRPYKTPQGNITAREAALVIMSKGDQWEKLQEEMRSTGMSTNAGLQQMLLLRTIQARLDNEAERQREEQKRRGSIQSCVSVQSVRSRGSVRSTRTAPPLSHVFSGGGGKMLHSPAPPGGKMLHSPAPPLRVVLGKLPSYYSAPPPPPVPYDSSEDGDSSSSEEELDEDDPFATCYNHDRMGKRGHARTNSDCSSLSPSRVPSRNVRKTTPAA